MSVFDTLKEWGVTEYRVLDMEDIEAVNLGSSVLATGGGGDPEIGYLYAKRIFNDGKDFVLIDPRDMPDDGLCTAAICLGSPLVLTEKPLSDTVLIDCVRALEQYLGHRMDALIPGECGGINSILTYAVAAALDIPVIDADGINRAFPRIDQTSWSIHGALATPIASADNGGETTIIDTKGNNAMAEDIARKVSMAYGGISWACIYPMTGRVMKDTSVLNSQSIAWEVGKAVLQARKKHLRPIPEIKKALKAVRGVDCYDVFEGKVVDINRDFGSEATKGFTMGKITMEGINAYKGQTATLRFQNEWLLFEVDGIVKCLPPDLIALLDTDTGEPIRSDIVKYGYRGTVLLIPVHERMRAEHGFAAVGPRAFGFDYDYIPLEELMAREQAGS